MKIEWIESKAKDWKIASISVNGQITENVSINRIGKTGEAFPNFDGLMAGQEVQGELWTSKAGKSYLFPIKSRGEASRGQSGAIRSANITKESVKEAQERKNESISYFNSLNAAISIVSHIDSERLLTDADLESRIVEWRDFFLEEWEKYENKDYQDKHKAF